MKMRFTLVLIACLIGSVFGQESYNYTQNGRDWGGKCANGSMQSPINIDTNSLTVKNNIPILEYFNYGKITQYKVEITRFTVEVTPVAFYKLSISGGGLPGKYVLDHVHFHWPAEHTVDGNRLIMEAHYVHLNAKYSTIEEAEKDPNGIAVLAVLYEVGEENEDLNYIYLSALFPQFPYYGKLINMLPYCNNEFYRYNGSLTTPGCAESVIWTVYKNYQYATKSQVDALRYLLAPEDQTAETYRVVQPLNGRRVELWSPRKL